MIAPSPVEQATYPKLPGTMVGTTYRLPDGTLGRVVTRWIGAGTPRNVLLELEDGSMTVRPFRGLRRIADVCEGGEDRP